MRLFPVLRGFYLVAALPLILAASAHGAVATGSVVSYTTETSLTLYPANSSTPGLPVYLTATVAPTSEGSLKLTGTFTFFDGTKQLGAAMSAVSGKAILKTSDLADGDYLLTAVYSGDANFAGSTSPVVPYIISPPAFALTVSDSSATIVQGSTAQTTITLKSFGGLHSFVNFSCSGLAPYSACTFTPATLNTNRVANDLTTRVTINSFAPSSTVAKGNASPGSLLAAIGCPAGLILLLLGVKSSDGRSRLLLALLAIPLTMVALTGCSLTNCCGNLPVTPPGTYQVTITGTAMTPVVSSSTVFNLTITK